MSADKMNSLFALDGKKIGHYDCIQKLAKHYACDKAFLRSALTRKEALGYTMHEKNYYKGH